MARALPARVSAPVAYLRIARLAVGSRKYKLLSHLRGLTGQGYVSKLDCVERRIDLLELARFAQN